MTEMGARGLISVIIPCLNEAQLLESTLLNIKRLSVEAEFELLVVDGGSQDNTVNIARKHARVVVCPIQGRAWQMNFGAREALGDTLFFLNADMNLPAGTFFALKDRIYNQEYDGGGFSSIFSQHNAKIKRQERLLNFRFKDSDHESNLDFDGDNGIFVRRTIFDLMGGFKTIPVMEDWEFSQRLKKNYKSVRIREPKLIVSPRRYLRDGFLVTGLKLILIKRLYQMFGGRGE